MKKNKIVLSGMRPTGPLHLGHLAGALRNWIKFQEEYKCYYSIVTWHAFSSEYQNSGAIKKNTFEVAADWLSIGLDPQKSTLFIQSEVKEHAELHLLLSMIIPLPWLQRVPTFKEMQKELKEKEVNTYGFLGYPVLQTADILMYKADIVPVGEDQAYHLELAREITRRFNRFFGEVCETHPPPIHGGHPVRIQFLTQTRVRPPTFVLWANRPEGVSPGYRRFLSNQLRARYGFEGTPLRLLVKAKKRRQRPRRRR